MVHAVPDPARAGGAVFRGEHRARAGRRSAVPVFCLNLAWDHSGRGCVYVGWAGLGEVFARGETPNLGIIFEPQILLPILGLCVLAALPIVLKAVRGKKGL